MKGTGFIVPFPQRQPIAPTPVRVHKTTIAHYVRKCGLPWWILRSATLAFALTGVTACAANAEERVDSIAVRVEPQVRIFGGEDDDDRAATSSVVALKVARDGAFELCSGALVAPNLVLTARHCVIRSTTTTVSCDENGHSANGRHVEGDLAPEAVTIYTGASPGFGEEPNAVASAFIAPQGDYLCNSDIALVLLDRPIEGAKPLAVRMNGNVNPGETIRSVGYGENDKSLPIGNRLRRDGVTVLARGAGVSKSHTALGSHEFEVGESICEGDSGGPAISEATGAIVGVVSRGGGCNDVAGHIYTTTTGWTELFTQAFGMAGVSPSVETGAPEVPAPGPEDEPSAAEPSSSSGGASSCSATPARAPSLSAAATTFAAALLLRRRRKTSGEG